MEAVRNEDKYNTSEGIPGVRLYPEGGYLSGTTFLRRSIEPGCTFGSDLQPSHEALQKGGPFLLAA